MSKDVYLRAAKLIDSQAMSYSCCAIDECVESCFFKSVESDNYADLFKPSKILHSDDMWGNKWGDTDEECKQCRVLALVFMRWISQGNDK